MSIQQAVNQSIGTIGTLAGLSRVAKASEKSAEASEKSVKVAEEQFKTEQALENKRIENIEASAKELLSPIESKAGKTKEGIQKISPALAKEKVYVAEQLEKHYLQLGDLKKAAAMREQQVAYGDIYMRQEQALKQAEERRKAKQLQKQRYNEFANMFSEGGRYK